MDTLKDCTNCQKHVGKKSIDDVHKDCYECVSLEKTLGYYPNWEPIAQPLGELLRKKIEIRKVDNVNSPKHYTAGGIETIDYIKAKLGVQGTIAYCMGNVIKYTSRWQDKNGLEDLQKALWYLQYATNLMKENNVSQ